MRQRVIGKAIAESLQGELASAGDFAGCADCLRIITEQFHHIGWSFETPLIIDPKRTAGFIQRRAEPNAGHHIE